MEPESSYLSVFLRSMRIVDVRAGVQRFHGAVSSYCSLPHRSGDKAEFFVLTTPAGLKDVQPKHADRVLTLSKRLLGPVPYRGGDLEVQLGLFSIKAADLAGPYLDLLETMSTVAGISFLGPAAAFVTPLRKGLDLLVGSEDPSVLEIGLSTTFSPPETGVFCLIGADQGDLGPSQLRLDANYRLLTDQGEPVTEYPYLTFSVESHARRDDWFQVPQLREAHQALTEEVYRAEVGRVEAALAAFQRAAVLSPDLLARDGSQLAERIAEEVRLAMKVHATSADRPQLRPLQDVDLYR